jgi:asparagine synthase (glutamine-hydrolysing)
MLSGGLDSSSIVGLISKEFRSHLSQPLRTFSLVRHDREKCSDWHSIQQIVKNDDWIDPMIITSAVESEVCRVFLDNLHNYDEPFCWDFSDSLVFDAAQASGCRVVLEGMAGDLLFYHPGNSVDQIFRTRTYWRIPFLIAACQRHGVQRYCFQKIVYALYASMPKVLRDCYRKLRDKSWVAEKRLHRMEGSLLAWMNQDTAREFLANKRSSREASLAQVGLLNDQIIHSRNFTTGCLSFAHEMSAQRAFSKNVELRSPFSDRLVIEFALRMPMEAKLSIPWYKYILRQAMAGRLPDSVRWRRDLWQHPGWRFNETLIDEAKREFPEELSFSPASAPQNRWLDAAKVNGALRKYDQSADFILSYNLLVLLGLMKWLKARPCMVQFSS